MADKDHPGFARALPTAATVHTCRPEVSRAESADVLATVYEETGADRVSAVGDVDAAFDAAVEAAAPGDCVLVTGSLYVVGAARARFARTTVPVRADTPAAARRAMAVTDVPDGEASAHVDDVLTQTVRTRVGPGRADRVRAAVLAAGGTCVLSGVDADEEARDLLVNGSLSTLEDAADRLAEDGLTATAGDLRRAVGHTGNHDGARALSLATTAEDPPWGTTPPWADGTAVMGILNITPDSFHDGGEYDAVPAARRRAEEMVAAGVDVLDVGGESTRPGADPVSPTVERERVVPVIEAIADLDALVSVDTRKAAVARAAIEAGADIINDVSGLSDPEMRFVAAETGAGLVVMHSIDAPVVPDHVVDYDDVVADLVADLRERVFLAERAGVPRDRIVVDPGVGFGKSPPESFELLDRVDEFHALGLPVLVGHSHKSMFGALGYEDGDRLPATVAATALAVDRGADLVRVHDAVENVAAVRTALATRGRFDD
jgi:dihydropteroate synthase